MKRNLMCSQIGRLYTVKMALLPKVICRFSEIDIKIIKTLFTELGKIIQNFIWKHKRPQIVKRILRRKSTARCGGPCL